MRPAPTMERQKEKAEVGKFGETNNDRAYMEQLRREYCEAHDIEYVPHIDMTNAYLGPRPKELNFAGMDHGKSEWEALGLPVPFFRRSAGIRHLRAMGFTDRERMDEIVGKMCNYIERDDSHMALEVAMRLGCDATACYRMLAVLLAEPKPPEEPEPEATFVDLVTA